MALDLFQNSQNILFEARLQCIIQNYYVYTEQPILVVYDGMTLKGKKETNIKNATSGASEHR